MKTKILLALLVLLIILARWQQGRAEDPSDTAITLPAAENLAETLVSADVKSSANLLSHTEVQQEAIQEAKEETEAAEESHQSSDGAANESDNAAGNNGGSGKPSSSSGKPSSSSTTSASGGLHVEGTHLVNAAGQIVQLRGISTHGIAWYPEYINSACFNQLSTEWNANVIRLAMYTAEYGGYCSGGDQSALKQLIRNGVQYATAAGMYVIIDWHILSDSNPLTNVSQAKTFFSEMSAEFADYSNVLYEICNEPNGGTSWSDIKSYARQVIPAIRENAPNAVILVGTPNWSQYVDQAAADPLTEFDNIMYTLHFYAATHTDSLRSTLSSAVNAGLPIFVSEFGICDASGAGAINEAQADKWISLLDSYGISYVAWNLSNKSETCALLRTDCSLTSGFSTSNLSDSGKWVYKLLTGKAVSQTAPAPQTPSSDDSSKPASKPTAPSTPAAPSTPSTPSKAATSADLKQSLTLTNSWESGGQTYYQYSLTLSNPTSAACETWKITLNFSANITLSNGWNGDYEVSGSSLTITAKDYNAAIPAGGSTGDIGFIISGPSGMTVK